LSNTASPSTEGVPTLTGSIRTNLGLPDGFNPWPALWALVGGFFMILIDTTIVNVANPAIMRSLKITDVTTVLWVTSAYLLAYAVPLLIAGRLGDRFGPKRLYLLGLAVFTVASLWCGLSGDINGLITARAVQGLGAGLMTPQTMSVITRMFLPHKRGSAMAIWGATAGIATLIGPLLGGVLVDGLGWEWIFFVNVPIGIIAFIAALWLVPNFPTQIRHFDWLGVVLSGIGIFLLVFGIQEGEKYRWGTITGPITVWGMITTGISFLAVFIFWQAKNRAEPLMPLALFRDRDFSLANIAITLVGVGITALPLPLAFYYQVACGLKPTEAALMLTPMSITMGALAPIVGRRLGRVDVRWFAVPGFILVSFAAVWYALLMRANIFDSVSDTGRFVQLLPFLFPSALLGIGMAGIWGPLATTVTRNLPMHQAGAGSGVFNQSRQIGSVLGSAAIAALMTSQLTAHMPKFVLQSSQQALQPGVALPKGLGDMFGAAMSDSMWLAIWVFVAATVIATLFVSIKRHRVATSGDTAAAATH